MAVATALAITSAAATLGGSYMQYQSSKEAEKTAKAQADYEKASTSKRVAEERSRTSQNLLRAQEEKRKELSKQRAAFIKAGVLPDSPSADMVIGELGENLQTRIQDVFTAQSDRMSTIQAQGNARHFNAMQNAKAYSRQATGALISGAGSLASSGYKAYDSGLIGGYKTRNAPRAIVVN